MSRLPPAGPSQRQPGGARSRGRAGCLQRPEKRLLLSACGNFSGSIGGKTETLLTVWAVWWHFGSGRGEAGVRDGAGAGAATGSQRGWWEKRERKGPECPKDPEDPQRIPHLSHFNTKQPDAVCPQFLGSS